MLVRRGNDWEITLLDREYRIRGLAKNLAYDTLRINLRVACGDKCHMDNVDMCQARQRAGFFHQAAQELGIPEETIKSDIGKLLLALESLQDKLIQKTLRPDKPAVPVMSERERAEAEAFLRRQDLTSLIVHHFHVCGLVGEDTNCHVSQGVSPIGVSQSNHRHFRRQTLGYNISRLQRWDQSNRQQLQKSLL